MKMPKQIWNSFSSAPPRYISQSPFYANCAQSSRRSARNDDFDSATSALLSRLRYSFRELPVGDEGSRRLRLFSASSFLRLLPFMLRSLQRDHANLPNTTTASWLVSCCPALAAMQSPRDVWGPEVVQLVRPRGTTAAQSSALPGPGVGCCCCCCVWKGAQKTCKKSAIFLGDFPFDHLERVRGRFGGPPRPPLGSASSEVRYCASEITTPSSALCAFDYAERCLFTVGRLKIGSSFDLWFVSSTWGSAVRFENVPRYAIVLQLNNKFTIVTLEFKLLFYRRSFAIR